jgi:hypothetical protein
VILNAQLIVTHGRRPTVEEQEVLRAKGFPWPKKVEALRQEWPAAIAAELPEPAAELREQLDAAFKEHGFFRLGDRCPWRQIRPSARWVAVATSA